MNLGSLLQGSGDLVEAEAALREAAKLGHRAGAPTRFAEGNLIDVEFTTGRWEAAEGRANTFLEVSQATPHYLDGPVLLHLGLIRFARDAGTDVACADVDRVLEAGRKVKDPQSLGPALAFGAFVYAELGERRAARSLLDELEPHPYLATTPPALFAAAQVGMAEEVRALLRAVPGETSWVRAAEAVLDGRWTEAAEIYDEMGARPYGALAALRAAEMFVGEGRRAEADEQLSRALAFFRSVGATRYIREGEALLAATA